MKKLVMLVAGSLAACLLCAQVPAFAESEFLAHTSLPTMTVPADNPQTDAKIRLGKQLYFDKRLSADNTISCATCHDPKMAWANHNPTDTGFKSQVGNRNSGTILDSGYMKFQFWDGRAGSLEEQALGPIHNPIEMGETLENVVRKLNAIPDYVAQFQNVFGTNVNTDGMAKAIASFERTVVSGPSPYDRWLAGDKNAMSQAAVRGLDLFKGKAHCTPCHSGPTFSDQGFHNLGVGFQDGKLKDIGRFEVTKLEKDKGAFKTPGLRNVELTFPYLHDGSEKTLEDVVEFYNRGGVPNPHLDPLMLPLQLTASEKADLVAFLKALTGTQPVIAEP